MTVCVDAHIYSFCRLWKLLDATFQVSWVATKTFISALYMNDTMLVTGSGAGIVKIWGMSSLLGRNSIFFRIFYLNKEEITYYFLGVKRGATTTISPLRRIKMKGIHHYPIKEIYQCTYTDLVIIAKYEGKKKKDKVKVVEVKWN